MQFQEQHSQQFEIAVAWQEPDLVRMQILRCVGTEQHSQTFYFAPAELSRLRDYIQDQLCL
jgi:hypothetical protein